MLLALIAGAGASYFYFSGMSGENRIYDKIGGYFLIGQTAAILLSSLVLVYALITGYFKIEYVAQYTDLKLPLVYKLSAFWAGQAGSLLFWAMLAVLFGFIEYFRLKDADVKYKSAVLFVSSITSVFFLVLTCFVTNPFSELDFFPKDGVGMNPLLQNPGMIYHPPTLYLGFVGFTIPLGHAVASMVMKDGSANWVKNSRGWAMFTWIFLTIGIVLGGQWAYVELGWGGYWAWDPVENASLLPWITATAYMHAAYIYEQRGKLKIWTHTMIMVSYLLCIFGTFLTRSGVMDSVHSFGKSNLGIFFVVYMTLAVIAYVIALAKNIKLYSQEEEDFHFTSREGLFFLANWLFLGLMIVVLVGTIMPLISQGFGLFALMGFSGSKLTVSIPYYNKVSTPFFIFILFLAGVAPLVQYGKKAGKDFVKQIIPALAAAVVVMAVIFSAGYTKIVPLVLAGVTTLSLGSIITRIAISVKRNGAGVIFKQRRHYGGLIVHIGVVIMAYGIIASSFYNSQAEYVVAPGEKFTFGNYEMVAGELSVRNENNFTAVYAPITVTQNGQKIVTVGPERRFYEKRDEAWAEVSIYSKIKGDLYFILASYSKADNYVGIQVVFEPLIIWIWIGCAVMVLGGAYSVSGRRKDA
jgi:cytochrome c-type biogenesis protein CcmF